MESKLNRLESEIKSLRCTLLFVVVMLIGAACVQYKIDDSLKEQIRANNSIQVQEVKYVE